jgi:hypothetical protein
MAPLAGPRYGGVTIYQQRYRSVLEATPWEAAGRRVRRPRRSVYRRALRRELVRLREPRRILAILLIGVSGGLALAFMFARGELAGADARAYWAAVRTWLGGGDPYAPVAPFMPYPYAPWLLPLFAPWALLPWHVAWFSWRVLNLILLAASASWAYRRHPLATAALLAALMPALAVTLDTGNITLLLAVGIWAAQFTGPRLGGAIWALTVSTKWFPALLLLVLPPRTRLWALIWLAMAALLSLATFPETVTWIATMLGFPRPPRVDYLVLIWAAVPWLWRHPNPLWWVNRTQLRRIAERARLRVDRWSHGLRSDHEGAAIDRRTRVQARLRAFFGVG